MINNGDEFYAPGVMDYLNDYPAFRTNSGTIDSAFYHDCIAALAYTCDPNYGVSFTKRIDSMIDEAGISKKEFDELIKPVIQVTWPCNDRKYRRKITMEMAEAFLKFIEPFWCEFKGIESTGYIDNLLPASYLMIDDDDNMFVI